MSENTIFSNSYTEKDYESIRNRIVAMIPQITDGWTDFNESEPGMAYLEIAAGLADMLCYYLDKQALENYLSTVEQRKNAKSILSLVGYKMYYYRSSICNVLITLEEAHEYDILIPKYTGLIANKGTQFERQFNTMEEIVLQSGSTSINVNVKEGVLRTSQFKVENIERFSYKLPDLAIAEESVEIVINVGEGVELTEVPDIFMLGTGGLYFSVVDDKDGYSWINFMPDWKNHVSVANTTEIFVKYLISSGVEGTAKAGEINELYQSLIYNSNGDNVTNLLSVVNTENASGGSNPETVREAVYQAPRVVQTMWTAVTLRDFIVLSETIQGIRLVNAIDWSDHYGFYTTPSTVEICLVPEIGGVASTYLKNNLLDLLEERKLVALDVVIIDPVYINFNIDAKVVIKSRNYAKGDIQALIETKLLNIYAYTKAQFYEHIRLSKIISLIHDSHDTVGYVELNSIDGWKIEPSAVEIENEVLGALATKSHSGTFLNTPVVPYSIKIKIDGFIIQDNGNGTLISGILAGGQSNIIDYETGEFEFTLQSTPTGAPVADYEYVKEDSITQIIKNPLDDIVLRSNELPKLNTITLEILYEDEVGG